MKFEQDTIDFISVQSGGPIRKHTITASFADDKAIINKTF